MRDDFGVLICSHCRAETMTTHDVLRRQGYTGKIIVVIDDEDEQREEYENRYECVEVFCKESEYQKADGVIFGKKDSALYARNASYDIAKKYGLVYFAEIDDDMTGFYFRYIEGLTAKSSKANLDKLFDAMICFMDSGEISALSLMVQSDYIGGINGRAFQKGLLRAITGGFVILKTERRISFLSCMNEDYATSFVCGQKGGLLLRVDAGMVLSQKLRCNTGGDELLYKEMNLFSRAFVLCIVRPDCMKVDSKNEARVKWDVAVPMIMSERWRK